VRWVTLHCLQEIWREPMALHRNLIRGPLERIAEGSFPYWVCLPEEKCIGASFEKHRNFCRAHGLALSRHGHSVVWQREWYCVFRFAEQEHADLFMKEFGGEP